ncbi:MAG: 3D-(3,5/4)-trihydroxycyclohexane-1,2-dione acylhydrolase (decyclizing) [Chloroflexi bacterium]|nr:MAG: 3D-(3,5/4)-trihydroxycyclohexane-1,2-dione acylhydrolase (decyclizing) [Chloroflexota bacterium]
MSTTRLTTAQAVVRFLQNQFSERDGVERAFFAGCFGIFGHGNVSGMGQALQQYPAFRYYQTRNEQAMVHTAAAFAKHSNRLATLVCTTSIGPGATNMLTGAATATVNRLPVLLLPGDIFARRNVAPVLQQLESESSQDISVNDAFKPLSRYWDRIYRPEQIITSLPEAMRVLTSPAQTGAVTLCLPQDVQTEAFDYPVELFQKRVWRIPRSRADAGALQRAADAIRAAKQPLIIAGGGVLYSEATHALRRFVEQTGIPVGETMAGKGSLAYDNPLCLGAVGVTGTSAANIVAKEADLIIGIGTRYSDFTTASKTQFRHPDVRFVNINVAEFDSHKHSALPVTGDAKVTLDELAELLFDYRNADENIAQAQRLHDGWEAEVDRIYSIKTAQSGLPFQGGLIGAVNEQGDPAAVMVGAAGSLPGDLHKLWRTRHPKQYHLEYGYSCMGYEIAGGLGVKMADPAREVYVLVGDGSFLMMNADITTSVQEGFKLTIVLMDNAGYKSIGGLSRSLGQSGFGTRFVYPKNGHLVTDQAGMEVESLPIDLAQNAASLGAHVIRCQSVDEVVAALQTAKTIERTVVIHVTNDRYLGVPGYESWWDVPVAEVSELDSVNAAREEWEEMRTKERYFLG